MSQSESDTTPNVSADFNTSGEPPAWPKVVGIISIVLASLSLICGGCGLVQNVIGLVQGGKDVEMPNSAAIHIPPPSVLSVGLGALGWVWAVVLLVAGIMTVKRHAKGRLVHLVYAGVSIVLTIGSVAVGMAEMQRVFDAFGQNAKLAQMAGMIKIFTYAVMCFAVTLGLGYPLFLLTWFGMMGKRPEAGAAIQEPLV
jgi:hypothetical protein